MGGASLSALRSEAASPQSYLPLDRRGGECIGSIGELMPSMRCKVVAVDSGREVGVGEIGELWLAGPNIMQGYLNRPEATASTIDGGCVDSSQTSRSSPCSPGADSATAAGGQSSGLRRRWPSRWTSTQT